MYLYLWQDRAQFFWIEKQDYEHAFRMGISAGSASAFSELLATEAEIRQVYASIEA